jgi:hypothetical protein
MNRLICCVLTSALFIPVFVSGCSSSSVDAAAKWDGKELIPGPPPKKGKTGAPAASAVKKVRGFTVPG